MNDLANQKTLYDAIPPESSGAPCSDTASNGEGESLGSGNDSVRIKVSIDDAIDAVGLSWSPAGVHCRLFTATGLLFMVDSMELGILAFLSRAIDQRIEEYHDNYIAWSGVGGSLVGAIVLGFLADNPRIGRRKITICVSWLITIFGIATALLCTTKTTSDDAVVEGLLVSRFLVGFGLGGLTIPYDLLAEWLPNVQPVSNLQNNANSPFVSLRRGQVLLLVYLFWSVGSLLIFGLLQTDTRLSPQQGQFTGIELWWCTLPAVVATILLTSTTIFESPRFLLAHGKHDEALSILKTAAIYNGKDLSLLFPPETDIRLYSSESQSQLTQSQSLPTSASDNLFSNKWLKLASALLFTYFGQAFCYRGTANMLVATFNEDQHPQQFQSFFSAISEVVGIMLLLFTIEAYPPWGGRVLSQVASYALAALSCLTLAAWYAVPSLKNGNVLIVMTFIARMLIFGGGVVTWVSTTEVLRTEHRTTGHAIAAGVAGRLGAFVATLAFPEIDYIPSLALIVFFGGIAIALTAGDIPETRGKDMGRSYNLLGPSER